MVNVIVNQPVQFTDNSTGKDGTETYTWDFGDGATSALQSPTHTYTVKGTYTVVHGVKNSCNTGPSVCTTQQVTVVETITLSSISITGCTSVIGIGNTCTLTASCKDTSGASMVCPTLTWLSSNPSIARVVDGVVTGLAVGTVDIIAKDLVTGIASNIKTVTVQTTQPVSMGFSPILMIGIGVGILYAYFRKK